MPNRQNEGMFFFAQANPIAAPAENNQERDFKNSLAYSVKVAETLVDNNLNYPLTIFYEREVLPRNVEFVTDWIFIEIDHYTGEFRLGKNIDNGENILQYIGEKPNGRQAAIRATKNVKKSLPEKEYFEVEGFKFKKPLSYNQKMYLRIHGYENFIKFNPLYEYIEKFKLDKEEQITIVTFELANYYAVLELESILNRKYDEEKDLELYTKLLEKHTKNIIKYKKKQ